MRFVTERIFPFLLSQSKKMFVEKMFFMLAISLFVVHILITLVSCISIASGADSEAVMPDPLDTIYTPFSVILLYEVYLLIFYLPRSITTYIGKQYEIITLILVRKLFHDIPMFSEQGSFNSDNIVHLLVSLGGLLTLCALVYVFYKFAGKKKPRYMDGTEKDYSSFVAKKKILSVILVAVFFVLFSWSFRELYEIRFHGTDDIMHAIREMTDTFFNDFFVVLILTEVLLLLFTFSFSDKFDKVLRNSGFIISTMLLKLSFRAEGNTVIFIMLAATAFGVAVLAIYKMWDVKPVEKE